MEGRFIRGDGIAWLLRHNLLALAMWRVVILLILLLIAGCQHRRPDFMTRVKEDCAARDQWACDLLESLAKARATRDAISGLGQS